MRKSIIPKMVARVSEVNGQEDIILRLLNSESASLFLRFLIPDFHQVIKVSGKWYVAFQQVLKEYLEQLDNKFIKTYFKVLSFKNSEFNATKFKYNDRQMFRWDRIIYAEVLPGYEGKQVTLGFKQKIKQEYKFDIIAKKDIRTVWVLKQDTKHDYDSVPQTSCVQEIRVGDTIKIAINFYNRSICLDLQTLNFDPPKIEDRIQRQCPIEKYYFDWVFYQYYQFKEKNEKNFDPALYSMSPQLRMMDCRISGSDTRAVKFIFHADEKGLANFKKHTNQPKISLGIPIEITDGEIVTEIMRYGLVADLQSTILLKKNDILILYLTIGD